MKTFMTESKTAQTYPTQQKPGDGRHEQTAPLRPTHNEIARRAYEIYLKNGRMQGQSELDWLQAEKELRKERKI
jgi:hypothetical protein